MKKITAGGGRERTLPANGAALISQSRFALIFEIEHIDRNERVTLQSMDTASPLRCSTAAPNYWLASKRGHQSSANQRNLSSTPSI